MSPVSGTFTEHHFNIREGNSLIGFTDVVNSDKKGATSLSSWNLYSQYEDLIKAVNNHRKAESAGEANKMERNSGKSNRRATR